MITIYGLTDPRTEHIRYVGKTINVPQRVKRHIYNARKGEVGHKANWIRSLLREGLSPKVTVLERCPEERWEQAEKIWIASLRRAGYQLTNATYGGEGSRGRKGQRNSPEHRAKISAAMKGKKLSAERRAHLRQIYLGKKRGPMPVEQREKLSRARKGMVFSEEHRKNLSISHKGQRPWSKVWGETGLHFRWHVNRDKRNPQCEFCQKGLGFQAPPHDTTSGKEKGAQ